MATDMRTIERLTYLRELESEIEQSVRNGYSPGYLLTDGWYESELAKLVQS